MWRYHCRSIERPDGTTTGGKLCWDGAHVWSVRSEKCSSSESDSILTHTEPGVVEVIVKWWYFLMPFSFFNLPVKCADQLYMGTTTSPHWVPTSCAMLASAEMLTTCSSSERQDTFMRRKRCLSRPKHQSGANLVWPTMRKERLTWLWSPTITLHIR